MHSWEIVVADSASTDRTVAIVRRHPVILVQLRPEWPLSSAAGRYVGLRHATGELVLFVDGDYVLLEDWLPSAIHAVRGDPSIAAVCGRDLEEFTGDSLLMRYAKALTDQKVDEPEAIPIGLYRRRAIDAVGGIHPFLRGGEDRDLAYRLRAAGYRLVRLNRDMGIHRWSDHGPLDLITYLHSVLVWSIGDGQASRARFEDRGYRAQSMRRYANVRHLWNHLLGVSIAILGLTNVSALLGVGWIVFLLADGAAVGVLLAARIRFGGSWRELAFRFHVVPYSIVRQSGFVVGFLRRAPEPTEYPFGETVVRIAHSGAVTDGPLAVDTS